MRLFLGFLKEQKSSNANEFNSDNKKTLDQGNSQVIFGLRTEQLFRNKYKSNLELKHECNIAPLP